MLDNIRRTREFDTLETISEKLAQKSKATAMEHLHDLSAVDEEYGDAARWLPVAQRRRLPTHFPSSRAQAQSTETPFYRERDPLFPHFPHFYLARQAMRGSETSISKSSLIQVSIAAPIDEPVIGRVRIFDQYRDVSAMQDLLFKPEAIDRTGILTDYYARIVGAQGVLRFLSEPINLDQQQDIAERLAHAQPGQRQD